MARDVSYTTYPLGGVTEHRVRATRGRAPVVTLCLLALHGFVAWRLWRADWTLFVKHLSVRDARASLSQGVSLVPLVQPMLLVFYLLILLKISHTVLYESVTVFPGLGVQVTSTRRRFFQMRTSTRFVPANQLRSIVIHEGLGKWNVHYYLGIVTGPEQSGNRTKDEGKIVVAFENIRPPLSVLKQVYHAVQAEMNATQNANPARLARQDRKVDADLGHGADVTTIPDLSAADRGPET